jgi:hypothetical protein
MLDVPLVVMATRWFRGMHPVSPEMTPAMRARCWYRLLVHGFVLLAACRRFQLQLESDVDRLQRQSGA